ncbi:hypothetical protein [Azospirillum doebereinerae]|uniref:Uncharacterized protein n=1 Tax=Azospirillum doebereinerae TaxID=92933 RepID=A0A3S0V7S0_9PROT|nr:hypothetical protein [Azospirillum doebereinerae]MCG5239665.1 hypothetical protein [Azospirillum doebereinerae]RUQ74102.1 hypothetical protein EJ913_06975 [Azospirillum doebereinerae]
MTTELTVSISLQSDDPHAASRFENALRDWLARQPGVTGMAVAEPGGEAANAHVWRAARKEAFGPSLKNPFAP